VDPAIIQNDTHVWDGVGSIVSNKFVHKFRQRRPIEDGFRNLTANGASPILDRGCNSYVSATIGRGYLGRWLSKEPPSVVPLRRAIEAEFIGVNKCQTLIGKKPLSLFGSLPAPLTLSSRASARSKSTAITPLRAASRRFTPFLCHALLSAYKRVTCNMS
jgi:hypothetical protein